MSQDMTVEHGTQEAGDLAPTERRPHVEASEGAAPSAVLPAASLSVPHPRTRHRTGGEWLFDITTYGGLGMVGNEIAATTIVQQAERANAVGRAYRGLQDLLDRHGPKVPYVQQRLNWTTFALGGGMLMVPLIKLLEDHKGRLVRFSDRIIHGKRSETDPGMQQAHDEMDHAPRQTWASLWKGRAVTVAAAYAVDVSFIWQNAWTSKLFKGTRLENYSTLERISDKVADKIGDSIVARRPSMTAEKLASVKSWTRNGVGLFSFTTVLALLFYGSSKLFASRQEKRRELREIVEEHQREHSPEPTAEQSKAHVSASLDQLDRAEAVARDEAPPTKVHGIEPQSRVAALGEGLQA